MGGKVSVGYNSQCPNPTLTSYNSWSTDLAFSYSNYDIAVGSGSSVLNASIGTNVLELRTAVGTADYTLSPVIGTGIVYSGLFQSAGTNIIYGIIICPGYEPSRHTATINGIAYVDDRGYGVDITSTTLFNANISRPGVVAIQNGSSDVKGRFITATVTLTNK